MFFQVLNKFLYICIICNFIYMIYIFYEYFIVGIKYIYICILKSILQEVIFLVFNMSLKMDKVKFSDILE